MDLTIIVPTYNRKLKLRQCLASLFAQSYPKDGFEITVIDDGSNDGTRDMLAELSKINPNLRYFIQQHKGPAVARNSGIKYASAEIIGFTDSDCILNRDWVRQMVQAHRSEKHIAAIGGATEVASHNIMAKVSQSLSDGAIEAVIKGKSETIFFPTCNVSFKRDSLANGFNELFPFPAGEDLDLFWRLFKKGSRFSYKQDIKIFHDCHTDIISFLKQAYMYGRGNYLVQHIHKDHPLLKEIKTQNNIYFIFGSIINFLKIPRFSYTLGIRLIRGSGIKDRYKESSVYAYFVLHKIFYLFGNIREFIRSKGVKARKGVKVYHVPELVIMDITHSCNLRCRICDIWKTAKTEKDIGIDHIKKLLSQAKKLGVREVALSGGEALLRKDIFEILDYARNLKIKNLGILTNGILVREYFDRIKPYLIDNSISPVISLDSLKEDLHNQIRNSISAWQETSEALRMLSSMKKEYPGISFNVITIILNKNLEELPDLALFIKSLGADTLQFQALLPNNLNMSERKRSAFWISPEELPLLDKIIDKLIEFKQNNAIFIKNSINNLSLVKKYYRGNIDFRDIKCLSAHKTILVSNRGECTACFSCYGDIKKQEFKDILKSNKILVAREKAGKCRWPCLLPCFCD